MHTQRKRFFPGSTPLILIILLVTLIVPLPVFAAPANDLASLAKKQEELDKELEDLTKDLHQVEKDRESCEAKLQEAQAEVDSQYSAMKDRIRYMYEEGDVSMLNVMFDAKNMADFVNRAEFVSTMSDYDRSMLEDLRAAKKKVQDEKDKLAAKEKELNELKEDRVAKQEELAEQIAAALARMAAAQSAGPVTVSTGSAGSSAPVTISTSSGTFSWNGSVLTRLSGVNMGPSGKETYYNLNMNGVVKIMRSMGNNDQYWVRSDGAKMLGDYVIVAADLNTHPRGSIVDTSMGKGIVCDTGGFAKKNPNQIDIATSW